MPGSATLRRLSLALLGLAAASSIAVAGSALAANPADGDPAETVFTIDPKALDDFWLAAPGGEAFQGSAFVTNGTAPEGDTPSGAVFTPNGTKFLVAHRDSKNVIVYDAATRNVLAAIALSGSPNDVAVTADGAFAVTANIFEDTASILNLTTNTEVAVVPVGNQPGTVRCSSV